jgi:hypothetical protein
MLVRQFGTDVAPVSRAQPSALPVLPLSIKQNAHTGEAGAGSLQLQLPRTSRRAGHSDTACTGSCLCPLPGVRSRRRWHSAPNTPPQGQTSVPASGLSYHQPPLADASATRPPVHVCTVNTRCDLIPTGRQSPAARQELYGLYRRRRVYALQKGRLQRTSASVSARILHTLSCVTSSISWSRALAPAAVELRTSLTIVRLMKPFRFTWCWFPLFTTKYPSSSFSATS